MNKQALAEKVVRKMYDDDAFSQWLDIEVTGVKPGSIVLIMNVREEMTNGFKVSHGGIAFSLADSALAFASNTHGRVALALENNISFVKRVNEGDVITASAEELSLGKRIAVYRISVTNQNEELVAVFRGTVYRTNEQHFPNEE